MNTIAKITNTKISPAGISAIAVSFLIPQYPPLPK